MGHVAENFRCFGQLHLPEPRQFACADRGLPGLNELMDARYLGRCSNVLDKQPVLNEERVDVLVSWKFSRFKRNRAEELVCQAIELLFTTGVSWLVM
jgi:hypothetical protein